MPTYREDVHLGRKVPLIEADDLASNIITAEKIADGSVTTNKLADGAVTKKKLSTGVIEWIGQLLTQVSTDIRDWVNALLASIGERINGKQDILVSGENVKTINGESILGEGNLIISSTGGGSEKTCNCPKHVFVTQAEYDSLEIKEKDVLYFIVKSKSTSWVLGDNLPMILSDGWVLGDNLPMILHGGGN